MARVKKVKRLKTTNTIAVMITEGAIGLFNNDIFYYQDGIMYVVKGDEHKKATIRQIQCFLDGMECGLVISKNDWVATNPQTIISDFCKSKNSTGRNIVKVDGKILNQKSSLKFVDLQEIWFVLRID